VIADIFKTALGKEIDMPAYIVLGTYTDQGIRGVKDTVKRAESLRDVAVRVGMSVTELYWTMGQHDLVLMAEAPDDETMTAFALTIAATGNVRTQTLRAFTPEEVREILGKMG
jgi:uncharacterized protein with GYD domain